MNKGAMSTSRVAEADAMAVDEAGGVAPSREWMQAAQRALETDGILDGSPAKRHKVCICICTLMSQHTCTPKLLGESLSEDVQSKLIPLTRLWEAPSGEKRPNHRELSVYSEHSEQAAKTCSHFCTMHA